MPSQLNILFVFDALIALEFSAEGSLFPHPPITMEMKVSLIYHLKKELSVNLGGNVLGFVCRVSDLTTIGPLWYGTVS